MRGRERKFVMKRDEKRIRDGYQLGRRLETVSAHPYVAFGASDFCTVQFKTKMQKEIS